MLFLALAFASASPAHVEHRFGSDGFVVCANKFKASRGKKWVVPHMPVMFRSLPCFSPPKGEQLWQLIVDMVEAHTTSGVTMDVVSSRLRTIIEQ